MAERRLASVGTGGYVLSRSYAAECYLREANVELGGSAEIGGSGMCIASLEGPHGSTPTDHN